MIVEEFIENRIDIELLTESWLKDTTKDQAWLKQSTFEIQQCNQPGNKKGQNSITTPKNIKANFIESDHTHKMENEIWKTTL